MQHSPMVHLFMVLYQMGAGSKEITKLHGMIQNVKRLNTNGNGHWKGGKILKCTVANWKICLATKREYKSTCRRKKRQHVDSMSQHIDKLQSENSKSVWTLINNRKLKINGSIEKINMNLKVWYEYSKSLHSAM